MADGGVELTVEDAHAAFDRRRAAWLAEDLDGYMDCWVDEMVIDVPGRTITGRPAYRELAAWSFAWARPVAFVFHHLAVDGNVVLADWTITVERRRDGAEITWRGMSAAELHDGLIVWWREYYEDPVALREARTTP